MYECNSSISGFMTQVPGDKNKLINKYRKKEQYDIVRNIENMWIDLRSVYACTVNKSQGSTYDEVFIDLDDIKKCWRNQNQLARLLYVGASRPRNKIVLTGNM
jgi:ATP-dependent exoDNAse (exonuclease V) alpha subunit